MNVQNIATPVIIVTSHASFEDIGGLTLTTIDELDALLHEHFPKNYRGTIRIDQQSQSWRHEIIKKVGDILAYATSENASGRRPR